MDLNFPNNLDSDQVAEILKELSEKADSNASLQLGIGKAFNAELIDNSLIQEMRDVLYNEVGEEGWKTRWEA